MTVWIIISIILLAAFGPLFWLRPSKRERMLAKLREGARKAGLVVEITVVPKLDASADERVSAGGKARNPQLTVAAYRLPLSERTELAPSWCFLRHVDDGPTPVPGWTPNPNVPTRRRPAQPEAYWDEVASIVADLSDDYVGVEANATNACLYWKEVLRGQLIEDAIADIRARLRRLTDLQLRVEETLRGEAEGASDDGDEQQ